MLGFAVFTLDPPVVLFLGFLAYVVSGPILTLLKLREHRAERRTSSEEPDQDAEGGGA
jgi:CDP-diacylglycerol--serine O-phosphatidyltransferase